NIAGFGATPGVEVKSWEGGTGPGGYQEIAARPEDGRPPSPRSKAARPQQGNTPMVYGNHHVNCSICGSRSAGHGNNAWPVNGGRCCDSCNTSAVIPARCKMIYESLAGQNQPSPDNSVADDVARVGIKLADEVTQWRAGKRRRQHGGRRVVQISTRP